jgi:plasmid maintenance system antidote protein VapI
MPDRGTFRPDWISAPGDTIADILEERGQTPTDLAQQLGRPLDEISALLQGRLLLTAEVASRLEAALGVPRGFWEERESMYRAELTALQAKTTRLDEQHWLKELPVKDMVQFGWLQPQKGESPVAACLRFFGTPDLDSWRVLYRDVIKGGAFRKSLAFSSHPAAVAAWLRQGELLSQSIQCQPWNAQAFEVLLPDLRSLTRKKDPGVLPELISRCSDCGVAVVIVRAPSGCRASGATRFLSRQRALLLLSFRYLTDDQFWFTFFHEAGHLVLHGERGFFLEGPDALTTTEEKEANDFAATTLVPPAFEARLRAVAASHLEVIRLARLLGVSPGVVVGQLQHRGRIPRNYLNRLKRRYVWEEDTTAR